MDSLLEVGTHALIREYIDFALQQCFEILAQLDQVEQAPSVIHLNEKVDIAVRA